MIPNNLLHTCIAVSVQSSVYIKGELVPEAEVTSTFQGAVLPMSNEDLRYAPEGTYTQNNQKLYTNGVALNVGQRFTDTYDNKTYTVITELTHGPIHPLKRYIVTTAGEADVRGT